MIKVYVWINNDRIAQELTLSEFKEQVNNGTLLTIVNSIDFVVI